MNKNAAILIVALAMIVTLAGAQTTYRDIGRVINSTANAPAPTPMTLNSYVVGYVPNSIVANSVFINATYNGKNYSIMQLNATGNNFIIFNTTNRAYVFVLNPSTVFGVLKPYLVNKYYPTQNTINSINATMAQFRSSGQPPITDCLTETGLTQGMCTVADNTTSCIQKSCAHVSVCSKVLSATGGAKSSNPFAVGILTFAKNYTALNSSYNQYVSLFMGINKNNIGQNLQQMSTLASSISTQSASLFNNPVGGPPQNLTTSQLNSLCSGYGAGNGPWYCYAVGFCQYPTYNTIYLNNTVAQLNAVLANPISNSSISAVASAAIVNAQKWYLPILNARLAVQFNNMTAKYTPQYNGIIFNLTFINSRFKNTTLGYALVNLQITYNAFLAAGINQNLTQANMTISNTLSNASKTYKRISAVYIPIYMQAFNSTVIITQRELDYKTPPPSLVALGYQQAQINVMLNTQQLNITQLNALAKQTASIASQANGLGTPFTIEAFTKFLHQGAMAALLANSNSAIATKESTSALYVAGITLAVDLVIIGVIYYFTYHRLRTKGKIAMNPRVRQTWVALFTLLIILSVIHTAVTWWYASSANGFIPASSFLDGIKGSNLAYIVMNSTASMDPQAQQCAISLQNTLASQGHKAYVLNVTSSNSICNLPPKATASNSLSNSMISNSIVTMGSNVPFSKSCLNTIYASGTPTIVLNESLNNTVIFKGLYGDVIYAMGGSAQGPSCIINTIMRINK